MKTIVTHLSPDLDAIASTWLVKRFLPGWAEADIQFVPAGQTLNKMQPDDDRDIIHVDTGMGKFDHHQTSERTCATKIVYEYLLKEGHLNPKLQPSLERIANFATEIDHFAEVYYPEPNADRYEFLLSHCIEGLKANYPDGKKLVEAVFPFLDAVLQLFRNKVRAEEEVKKGFVMKTSWGKALVIESKNEEAMKVALKMHYVLVVRKDPEKGTVRFKTLPDDKYDLTEVYEQVLKKDPKATWFLHVSKHMLLNGSSKNPNVVPSALTTQQLIEIIKKI